MQEVSSTVQTKGYKADTQKNSKPNCYANTSSNSNLNNSNIFIPLVNNNNIEYCLPGPT